MHRLILGMDISRDGFAADADGGLDWTLSAASPELSAHMAERLDRAAAHLWGRRSFASARAGWLATDPLCAPALGRHPKLAFGRSGASSPGALDAPLIGRSGAWEAAATVAGDLKGAIHYLQQGAGGPLLAHGGIGFARSLMALGLVDEYRLIERPVTLGRGQRLFDDPAALRLRTRSEQSFPGGVTVRTLVPAPENVSRGPEPVA